MATTSLVYALALATALLWGFSPIVSKRGLTAGGTSLQASIVVVLVDSTLYWVALVAIQGVDLFDNLTPTSVAVFAAAGVVGTALGRVATYAGIARIGASVNSAGISTRPLFAMFLAVGFLGERVTPLTVVGIVVLVAGLVFLALSDGGDLTGWHPRELAFPVFAAMAFGVGNVVRKFALGAYPATVLEAVAINETAALVALVAYAAVRGRRDVVTGTRRTYGLFAVSGTLTAGALLALFAALDLGRVVIVDPLAATAPLFTSLFAWLFLRDVEEVTRRVVVGAVCIVAGVALITL